MSGEAHYSTVIPLQMGPIVSKLEDVLHWNKWCPKVINCSVVENSAASGAGPLIRRTRLDKSAGSKVLREEVSVKGGSASIFEVSLRQLPPPAAVTGAASALLDAPRSVEVDNATRQLVEECPFSSTGPLVSKAGDMAPSIVLPVGVIQASWGIRASLITDTVVGTGADRPRSNRVTSAQGFRTFVQWHADFQIGEPDAALVRRAVDSKQFLEPGEIMAPAAAVASRLKAKQLSLVEAFFTDMFAAMMTGLWATVMDEAFPVEMRGIPLVYRLEHEALEPRVIGSLVASSNSLQGAKGEFYAEAAKPLLAAVHGASEVLDDVWRSWEILARDNDTKTRVIQQLRAEIESNERILATKTTPSSIPRAEPPLVAAPPVSASAPASSRPASGALAGLRRNPPPGVLLVNNVAQTDPMTSAEPPRRPFYSQALRDAVSTGVMLKERDLRPIFADLDAAQVGFITDREIKAVLLTLEHFGSFEDKTGVTDSAEQFRSDLMDPTFVEKKIALLEEEAKKSDLAEIKAGGSRPSSGVKGTAGPPPPIRRDSSNAILVPLSPRVRAQQLQDRIDDNLQRRRSATFDLVARRWVDRFSKREKGKIFFEEFVLFLLQLCQQ